MAICVAPFRSLSSPLLRSSAAAPPCTAKSVVFGCPSLRNLVKQQLTSRPMVSSSGGRMNCSAQVETEATASAPFLTDHAKLIDSVETFIFDCDGVIWKGDSLIEGVPETLDMLRSMGKRLVFVTNNSTKSRKQYGKKFESLGLSVSEEEIFASSFAAAAYLKSIKFPSDKKVYIIGEAGIQLELKQAGINYIGGPEDGDKRIDLAPGQLMEHDHDVGAVVVGFDRYLNYYKLQYATLCIRENPGCMFIATNCDAVTHLTDAQEWAGTNVSFISYSFICSLEVESLISNILCNSS
uniref:phosphoglycolate phosphatase n=1 Tax=Physcomitrium patens TaxID=3218 RepID=A0A7I4ATF6_PHYPA